VDDGQQPVCTGIGPLAGTAVRVTSIWGGGLIRVSEDGWSIDIVPVDWPEQRVILQPPGCDVMTEHLAANCVLVVVPETEVRATGFDPT